MEVIEINTFHQVKDDTNKQNCHIAIQYEKAQAAMLALMLLRITILRVELEGPAPVIEVMNTGHCKKLDAHKYATIGYGSGRDTVMRAIVKDCIVQWRCDYQVH